MSASMSAGMTEKYSRPDCRVLKQSSGMKGKVTTMATGRAASTTVHDSNRQVWAALGLRALGHLTTYRS